MRSAAFAAVVAMVPVAGLASAGTITLPACATDVVVSTNAPKTVRFAAQELRELLGGVFGRDVPEASTPAPGRAAILLGRDACAGFIDPVRVDALPRDSFIIKTALTPSGPRVCIAGRDDPAADPAKTMWTAGLWMQVFERATLFGAYEFLERYAGVRMYFPGELGTITPRRAAIPVPEGEETVKPVYLDRSFSFSESGAWFEGEDRCRKYHPAMMTNGYRLRMQTDYKPCVHGINALQLKRRFFAAHPEWFYLKADGTRGDRLCWSSGIIDEIYKDVSAYLRGEPCESRDFHGRKWVNWGWPYNMRFRRWVDLMPQDGFQKCHCEKCRDAIGSHTNNYATTPVWNAVVSIANRLKSDGIKGGITCMAYWPYHDLPKIDIPDNVEVMVATAGPWSETKPGGMECDLDQARVWTAKLGRPVWLWTYANKWGNRALPDVPQMSPRAWGEYYKRAKGAVTGAFAESESDRFLYNYLNYYVFSKVCWNTELDVEALLVEHHRLMFGAAAQEMAAFFDALERKWMREIVGNWEDSPLGPMMATPSDNKLWKEIYSAEFTEKLGRVLDQAASRVSAGSLEARRIELFRREYFAPLKARGDAFRETSTMPAGWKPSAPFLVDKDAKVFSLGKARDAAFPALVPGGRYRLSFFVKTENVRRTKKTGEAGAVGNIWTGTRKRGYNLWFPGVRWFLGTMGWTRQSFEFTVRKDMSDLSGSYLRFALQHACGKMWIDGVTLELLP